MTLYEILELPNTASDAEIKKAYRKRAAETHPDAGGNNKEFAEVAKAYNILSDRRSRLIYDATGNSQTRTADNKRVDAIAELQRVMLQILDEMDDTIFVMNLPAHVLNIFNANISKSKMEIAELRKKVARLRRYKKRFHFKSKSASEEDFITIGINARIYACMGNITIAVEKVRAFELMLELLSSYDYEPETPTFKF